MINDCFETEFMEEKWQKNFDKLEDDFDSFRDYYNQNKKCKCDIDECKHFDKALVQVLGDRANNLCNLRLQIGFRTYSEHLEAYKKNN